jgi:hypothetical protein
MRRIRKRQENEKAKTIFLVVGIPIGLILYGILYAAISGHP